MKRITISFVVGLLSYVAAAVFGGGEHHWHLQQRIRLKKKDVAWLMTESVASTY